VGIQLSNKTIEKVSGSCKRVYADDFYRKEILICAPNPN
jgi:hypothetical protein